MNKIRQQEIMKEFGIPCPLKNESDEKYAYRMIEKFLNF